MSPVDFSLPVSCCVAPEISRGKIAPRDSGAQMPRHRVSVSWGYTDATQAVGVSQTVLQRETGGFTVLGCRSNRDGQLLAEKILPKKSVVDFSVFETFWEHCLIGRVLLSDYSVVKCYVLRF